jgi:hypothetical protein
MDVVPVAVPTNADYGHDALHEVRSKSTSVSPFTSTSTGDAASWQSPENNPPNPWWHATEG